MDKKIRRFGRGLKKPYGSPRVITFNRPDIKPYRGLTLENVNVLVQEDESALAEEQTTPTSLPMYSRASQRLPMSPGPKIYNVSIKYPNNGFDDDFKNVPKLDERLVVTLGYYYYLTSGLANYPLSQQMINQIIGQIKRVVSTTGLQRILPDDADIQALLVDAISYAAENKISSYKPEYYEDLLKTVLSIGVFDLKLENRLDNFFKFFLQSLNPQGLLSISEVKSTIMTTNFLEDVKELKKIILKALVDTDFRARDRQIYSLIDGRFDVPHEILHDYAKTIINNYRRTPKLKEFTENLMRKS